MKTIVPNKDFVFYINSFSRKFILDFNKKNEGLILYQVFPAWLVLEDEEMDFKKISTMDATEIFAEEDSLYLKLQIQMKDSAQIQTKKICLAKELDGKKIPQIQSPADFVPQKLRVFRAGQLEISQNTWKLSEEKWYKLKD